MTTNEKFSKILETIGLDFNGFAMKCGIIPNTLKIAIKRDAITSDIITKIHDRFGIRKGFFKDGKDPVLDEKHTHAHIEPAIPEKALGENPEEIYRKLVEGDTEYVLIPRAIFEDKYKLVAVEKIEQDKLVLEWLLKENEKYAAKLRDTQVPPVEVAKKKPGAKDPAV